MRVLANAIIELNLPLNISIQEHNQITKLKQGTLVKHKSEGFILMVTNTQRESNTFAGVMMYNNKNTDINIGRIYTELLKNDYNIFYGTLTIKSIPYKF